MRTLRDIHPDYALINVRPGGAAAYLTTPLLAFAALLPWLSQSATHGWLAPVALSIPVSLALICVRPRIRRVPLDSACALRLVPLNESEDPSYAAVLVRGTHEQTLLRHPSFDVVVRDLGRVLEVTGLALEESSGIPVQYFRSEGEPSRRTRETTTVVGIPSASHQRAARAVVGGALFAFVVFGWGLIKAVSHVSALSVLLPSISAILFAAFGLWMSNKRSHVTVSDAGLDVEEAALGRPRQVLSIPAQELLGAFVVERGEVAVEVLLATTRGPRALPLLGDAARRVAAAIGPVTSAAGAREAAVLALDGGPAAFDVRSAAGRATDSRRDSRRSNRPEVARARQS